MALPPRIPADSSLLSRIAAPQRRSELIASSASMPSITLTPEQACDVELILTGGFSPLSGFMTEAETSHARETGRLGDGRRWRVPVRLFVKATLTRAATAESSVALRDAEGVMLAVMHIAEVREAANDGTVQVGGPIEGIQIPTHHDFEGLWRTPDDVARICAARGWARVVAYHPEGPIHRADIESLRRVSQRLEAGLLIQALLPPAEPADLERSTRLRAYQEAVAAWGEDPPLLVASPLARGFDEQQRQLLAMAVARNYGCTHLVAGSELGSVATATDLMQATARDLGIELVLTAPMVYAVATDSYVPADAVGVGVTRTPLSERAVREHLAAGEPLPEWFTPRGVAAVLQSRYPARRTAGICIFLTGLSGAGKSTIAQVVTAQLLEHGDRRVTLLDGDQVRQHLSSELGFSREDRDRNIARIGFVAGEIAKHGGIAICAMISPYDDVRRRVRQMVESSGAAFILVHVNTPLDICESRDRKGLYAKARAGLMAHFTGIDDPYEGPTDAEVTIDTSGISAEASARTVLDYLVATDRLLPPAKA